MKRYFHELTENDVEWLKTQVIVRDDQYAAHILRMIDAHALPSTTATPSGILATFDMSALAQIYTQLADLKADVAALQATIKLRDDQVKAYEDHLEKLREHLSGPSMIADQTLVMKISQAVTEWEDAQEALAQPKVEIAVKA